MKPEYIAVGIIFENENGEVLVLKRHSESHEGETWGLIGGKIDDGEKPVESAVRECFEEIGVQIENEDLELFKKYVWEREDANIDFEVFKYKAKTDFKIELDQNENTEYAWFKPEELYSRKDLMIGLYPILKDIYKL